MSRFAVFPSFANSHDDYKTGEEAQKQRPLHPQMPANPYGITIIRQSKGNVFWYNNLGQKEACSKLNRVFRKPLLLVHTALLDPVN